MAEFVEVADADSIGEGGIKMVKVEGKRIVLVRVQGQLYALNALCTHEEGYLDEGELEGFNILCPIHFGAFDVRSGKATAAPATVAEDTYDVKVENGKVFISR